MYWRQTRVFWIRLLAPFNWPSGALTVIRSGRWPAQLAERWDVNNDSSAFPHASQRAGVQWRSIAAMFFVYIRHGLACCVKNYRLPTYAQAWRSCLREETQLGSYMWR